MAVGFSNTNKPLNPRGNDASPKGYNRAALYSGKALDFDGVNNYVDLDGFTLSGTTATFVFNLKMDDWIDNKFIFDADNQRLVIGTGDIGNEIGLYDSTAWKMFGTISDTTNTNNFAIVIDGTTAKCFLNGQSFGTDQTITNIDLSNPSNVALGSRNDGLAYFINGQMAGFKIFNTALTAAQVADLYNNPEKVVPTGVDNTALKLWLPMQEGAGTYCINGADPLGDDLYNGAGSFDSATGWTLNTGTSITGGQLVVDGTQTSNTVAYYSISEALPNQLAFVQYTISSISSGSVDMVFFGSNTQSKIRTEVGTYTELVEVITGHNGNTGPRFSSDCVCTIDNLTIKKVDTGKINGATWTHGIGSPVAQTAVIDWNKETTGAGTTMLLPQGLTSGRDITGVNLFENVRKQGALNLDGNSWAEVHDNASLDITDAITLEAWVYWDGSNGKGLLGRWSTGADSNYLLYTTSSSIGQFYINTTAVSNINTSTLTAGNWYHIVGTYDGSDMRIYLNGSESSNTSKTGSISTSADPIEIGRYYQSSSFAYADQIAQPRIYNRALTAAEVLQNYNSGKNTYK